MNDTINLFHLVDKKAASEYFVGDDIYIPKNKKIKLNQLINYPLYIESLKRNYGSVLNFSFKLNGRITLQAGVITEGKSFAWVAEKSFVSSGHDGQIFTIDLTHIEKGKLEIQIYTLSKSWFFVEYKIAAIFHCEKNKILYNFLFPTYELCCEIPLYCHFADENSWYSFENKNILLKKHTAVDFLTYFNSFSSEKWSKYTNLEDVGIYLDLCGHCIADLIVQDQDGRRRLDSWFVESDARNTYALPLKDMPETGILGLEIYAISDCTIYGGGYYTATPPAREVRLGIGITTYKREEAVTASVQRLTTAIKANPIYKDKIELTVVDNGSSLTPEQIPGAKLIPNRNLGGAGGFMRNLIHYQDEGKCTHCLFMDDDAFCEPGSIFRSISFLRHAKDDKTAISGAMLSENIQFLQWENGAWFEQGCHPLKCNLDLRHPKALYQNERENYKKPIYGAWWFFMFPLRYVKYYAFPFFVRGDDIEFSYLNDFHICTLNGVACWQEDFKTKESPQTLYFDIRSHLMHHLMLPELKMSRFDTIKMIWNFFCKHNESYQYDTAKSIVMAFNAPLTGPEYWVKNMDTQEIRSQVQRIMTYERRKPLNPDYKKIPYAEPFDSQKKIANICRLLSLNGHLLPSFMLENKRYRVSITDFPHPHRAYGRKKILVCNPNAKQQWLIGRNTSYYFGNLVRFGLTAFKFIFKYNALKKDYQKFFACLDKNKFWKDEFCKDENANKTS